MLEKRLDALRRLLTIEQRIRDHDGSPRILRDDACEYVAALEWAIQELSRCPLPPR